MQARYRRSPFAILLGSAVAGYESAVSMRAAITVDGVRFIVDLHPSARLYWRRASPRTCRSFVEEGHDPWSRDIAGFQPIDPKARIGKQIIDLAVQVAPA